MATNLVKKLYHRGKRVVVKAIHTGIAANAYRAVVKSRANAAHSAQQKATQKAFQARAHAVKSKVKGVQRATRSVTKGNRQQRAQQLRHLRANPSTRAALKRRAQFYTKP